MRPRSRIVWKLSSVFILVLLVVIAVTAYANNVADEHYALESAREVSHLHTRTILASLRNRMMAGDTESIREMVSNLASSTPVFSDLRLVSHDGVIVAGREGAMGDTLLPTSRSCKVCHEIPTADSRLEIKAYDEVVHLDDGSRVVSVMTPIFNEPGCRDAACHAHADAKPVLGFLQADFSLDELDELISFRTLHTAIFAAAVIALTVGLVWFLTSRLIDRPVHALSEGMKRFGEGDFTFRFDMPGNAEFSTLAGSFNSMADRLKASLTELRETRDYLEGIVEYSADIIITVNPGGYVYTFNQGAEHLLGYTREEVIGRNVEMLFADPAERDEAIERLKSADNVLNYEVRLKTKDGSTREVMLTLSRLRDPDGTPIGSFGIGKDVTEANRMQKKLVQSERLAAIGQALAGIQHGLKNMLNAMKGGAYMVRIGLKKEDRSLVEEGWAMVEEAIESLTSMSSHMLNYVREWKPELESVDIGEMVKKIEGVFAATATDKGVNLRVEVPDGLPPVHCDRRLVHTAVMDILSNALDACLEKPYPDAETPEIVVRAGPAENGSRFVLAVRDNGCGMSEKVRANVFAPFFSTKDRLGTGLGLAITKRTIRIHGGEIEVESEENAGSEFRIILPTGGPHTDKEEPGGQEGAGR